MTTVRKIAELAGVSISTVSLVMNDKPGVSDETREAVRAAIDELEMQARGRIVRSGRSNGKQTVSILVLHPPVPSSYYVFSQVLQGIQAEAEANRIQQRLVSQRARRSAGGAPVSDRSQTAPGWDVDLWGAAD